MKSILKCQNSNKYYALSFHILYGVLNVTCEKSTDGIKWKENKNHLFFSFLMQPESTHIERNAQL
jgi:hypothetical protein